MGLKHVLLLLIGERRSLVIEEVLRKICDSENLEEVWKFRTSQDEELPVLYRLSTVAVILKYSRL
jgi:hypothetical protein